MRLLLFFTMCMSFVQAFDAWDTTKTLLSFDRYFPSIVYDSRESHKLAIAYKDIENEKVFLKKHFSYVEDFTKKLEYNKSSVKLSKTILEDATKSDSVNVLYCPVEAELFAIVKSLSHLKEEIMKPGQSIKQFQVLEKKNIYFLKTRSEKNLLKELKNIVYSTKSKPKIYCGLIKTNLKTYYETNKLNCSDINAGISPNTIKNMFNSARLKNITISFGSLKRKNFCYIYNKPNIINYTGKPDKKFKEQVLAFFKKNKKMGKLSAEQSFSMLSQKCIDYKGSKAFLKNPNTSGGDFSVACLGGYNEKIMLVEDEPEPVYNKGLTIGCNGISYSGVFEQNIIDRLKNMKDVFNVALKPYTMCCNNDKMSKLQEYARAYGVLKCLPEVWNVAMAGTWNGHKMTEGMTEFFSSCTHNLMGSEMEGGAVGNPLLMTGGAKVSLSLSGAMNFSGCISKKFSELGLIDKFNYCMEKEEKSFMKIVEDMASQQMTLDISIDKFKADQCKQELNKPEIFDLSIPIPFAEEWSEMSTKNEDTSMRMQDEVNMYGVLKNNDLYSPVLMLQHKAAFLKTNFDYPVKEESKVPSYILSELKRELNVNKFNSKIKLLNGDFSNNCKQDSYIKIKTRLESLLLTANEEKTIDIFLYLYANNTLHLANDTFNDIGLFANSCNKNKKKEILIVFNQVLDKYIDEYTKNTPNNFYDSEKEIIKYSNKYQETIKKLLLKELEKANKIQLEYEKIKNIRKNLKKTCDKFHQTQINECIKIEKAKIDKIEEEIKKLESQKPKEKTYKILNDKINLDTQNQLNILSEEEIKFSKASESPMFLLKKHLEVYQKLKFNKEKMDFENYRELKSVLGIE